MLTRNIRRATLAALLVLACGMGGRVLANMVLGVAGPSGGQSIAAVTYTPPVGTFAAGAPSGALIGAMGVAMSPASPLFSGALSLGGTDLARFHLTSSTLPSNLVTNGVQAAGCYSISLIATQAGKGGSPFASPQTICSSTVYNSNPPWPFLSQNFAENYDGGAQGKGYIIPPATLNMGDCAIGTPYRSDQANLKTSTFTPPTIGYQVGCMQIGDSYNYTTNIPATATDTLTLWLADASSGGSWTVSIDGTVVGSVATPNTGSYTSFQPSTSGSFAVTAGNHILTLTCAGGDAQYNSCGDLVMWQGTAGGGSIACDQGPNAAAAPAPAQAAGFTRCLLNADFTSAAYTNPANWLAECGYSGSAAGTIFHLYYNDVPGAHAFQAPCNRAVMTTDLGNQVLLLQLFQNDYAVNGFDILELDWPTALYISAPSPGAPWGGPGDHLGLQHAQYAEVTYRMPQASAQGSQQFLPYAFWFNGGQPPFDAFTEVDFFEIYSNLCAINGGAPANTCTYASNLNMSGYANPEPNVPVGPAYTQSGFLTTTSDGINFGVCMYTNGGVASDTPQFCQGPAPLYASNGNVDPKHGLLESWLNNDCSGTPGCNPNTIQVYIASIKLWGCPNYWNGICTGTVITSSNEPETKFAERRAMVRRWATSAASWLEDRL